MHAFCFLRFVSEQIAQASDGAFLSLVPAKKEHDKNTEEFAKLAKSVAASLGLVLVAVNVSQQGKRRVLSITIHKKGSRVSLDDCENVSRRLEALLDQRAESEAGPIIEGAYALDVESPGIDRVLKTESEYKIFEGETVEVRLKESIEGLPNNLKGTLVGLHESSVRIKNPAAIVEKSKSSKSKAKEQKDDKAPLKEEFNLPLSSIYSVRLYPEISPAKSEETVI